MRLRLVLASFALVLVAAPAAAQKPSDLKSRVDALEARVGELAQSAAEAGTVAASVQDLAARVAVLERDLAAAAAQGQAHEALVERADQLASRVDAVERELRATTTQLADVTQPTAQVGGGAVEHQGGFHWATDDGHYDLTLGGYMHARYEARLSEDLKSVDAAGFRIRRARLFVQGHIGGDKLFFRVLAEQAVDAAPLGDAYIEYRFMPELVVRAGQAKVPFLRSWTTSSTKLDLLERPAGLDNLRYDRDIGAWLTGALADDRIGYTAGVSNGGGKNKANDNIDLVAAARVDAAVLGKRFNGYGDLGRSESPQVMVGAGVVHDLIRLPDNVAGIELGELDVDNDGVVDNIRALSGSLDAALRYRGLELAVEGYYRQERWGTILAHSGNQALADAVKASADGHRNYLGGYVEASYLVVPEVLVAARVSHSRLSLLGAGGATVKAVPPADRLLEIDLGAQLIQHGHRSLGVDYTFSNFNARTGPEPANDKGHRLIVEYQLLL